MEQSDMQGLDSGKSLQSKNQESQFTPTNQNYEAINKRNSKQTQSNVLNKQYSIFRKKTKSEVNEIDGSKFQNGYPSPFTNYINNLEEQQQKDFILKANSFSVQNELQSEGSPTSQISNFKDFEMANGNEGCKANVEDVFSYEYLQLVSDNAYIPSDSFCQKQKQKLKRLQQQRDQKKARESILSKLFRYRKINQVVDSSSQTKGIFLAQYVILKNYLGKQYEKKQKNNYDFIISPDSPFRITWDICIMFLIFYAIILTPFRMSFDPDDTFTILVQMDNIFDFLFMADIFLNFNTAIYRKGNLIRKRKQIALEYLKLWFWIDFFSSFPYELVVQSAISSEEQQVQQYTDSQENQNQSSPPNSNSNSLQALQKAQKIIRILKIFKIMKVLKLLRVVKLKFIIEKLVEYLKLSKSILGILGFLKLSSVVLFIAHWVACMWFYVGSQFPEDGWIAQQGLQNEMWQFQYITSIYWAITTMVTVGYGDIVPKNLEERVFVLFVMLMACGIFAYTMNTMGSVLSQIESFSSEYKKEIQQVNIYLDNKKIKLELKIRIRKYLEYIYESKQRNQIDETNLFSKLSSSLKNELIHQINEKIISDCHLFTKLFNKQNLEQFLFQISINLQEKITIPEEIIINQEDIGAEDDKSMYFIQDGEVEIFYQHSNSKTILKKLRAGSYFGEISFFTDLKRTASVQSVNFASLYYLKRSEFIKILQKFPIQKEIFYEVSDKIKNYNNFNSLNIVCFSCQQLGHISSNCPNLSFYFFRNQFVERMLQSRKKKGNDFQRADYVYMATIKDIHKIQQSQQKLEQTPLILSYIRVHDLDKEIKEEEPVFQQTGSKFVNTIKKAMLINTQKAEKSQKNQKKAQQMINNQLQNELYLQIQYWKNLDDFDKVKIYDHYFRHNNVELAESENDQLFQNGGLLRSQEIKQEKTLEITPQNHFLINRRKKFINTQAVLDRSQTVYGQASLLCQQQPSQISKQQEEQSESSESSLSQSQSDQQNISQSANRLADQTQKEKQMSPKDQKSKELIYNEESNSQAQIMKNSQNLFFFNQINQNAEYFEDFNLQKSENLQENYNLYNEPQTNQQEIIQLNQQKSINLEQIKQ